MPNLKSILESLLFVSSKPLSLKELVKFGNGSEEETIKSLEEIRLERKESGIILTVANNEYQLATNPENVEQIKTFLNSDLREKLTDATIEVLSIIAYRQPIGRNEIEAIRGVNSQYSIRHLLMRGLIEKIQNPNDSRGILYQVTNELLQQLGLSSINDLPDFETITANIKLPETPAAKPEEIVKDDNTKIEPDTEIIKNTEPSPEPNNNESEITTENNQQTTETSEAEADHFDTNPINESSELKTDEPSSEEIEQTEVHEEPEEIITPDPEPKPAPQNNFPKPPQIQSFNYPPS